MQLKIEENVSLNKILNRQLQSILVVITTNKYILKMATKVNKLNTGNY